MILLKRDMQHIGNTKEIRGSNESRLEQWISKVREILETNDSDAIEFIDDFRSSLFHDEVFVFTPKGDLKTLPTGATALDFAFDIHTEIGARCLGAKVNQKLVPLNHQLKNGDQVEILTSKKQKPNEDWLKYVATSKARSKIKDVLKEERKIAAIDGKEIVMRKLNQMKLTLSNEVVQQLLEYFKVKTTLELFYRVGKGKIDPSEIRKIKDIKHETVKTSRRSSDPSNFKPKTEKTKQKHQDLLLLGEDMDVIDYKFAKCCNPIPGDAVFGFVTVSEGIKIHRTTCPNAAELLSNYGYRVIKAKWTSSHDRAFVAGVKVIGTDRIGMINDISNVISSELNVNMRSLKIETEGGIFEGEIELYVEDTKHLDIMIKNLLEIESVVNVNRFS